MKGVHHLGYVVRSIDAYQATLPPMTLLKAVDDPLQRAQLALYTLETGSAIELIQPLDRESFTWNFLEKFGEGLHHVCYEGYSLAEVERLFVERKMLRLRGPVRAVLFERDVVFAMTRAKTIVEFIL